MSHPSGGLLNECYRLQNSGSLKWYYLTAVSTNIHNLDPVSHIQQNNATLVWRIQQTHIFELL
jgi:hypothetical protein